MSARKGTDAAIREAFSFLEERGFGEKKAAGSRARWESDRVFVSIEHDEHTRLVEITFGPLTESRRAAEIFDSEDLAELADPPGKLRWRFVRIRRPGQLREVLEGYAGFLQTRGNDILLGNPAVFEKLARARIDRLASDTQRRTRRLAKASPSEVEVVRRKLTPADEMKGPVLVGKLVQGAGEADDRQRKLEEAKRAAIALLRLPLDPQRANEWVMQSINLEPHPMDYERVFFYEAARVARTGYRLLWERDQPRIEPGPGHDSVKVTAFYSDWLRPEDERARLYPEAYRRIAHLLQPDMIWLAWKFVGPDDPEGRTFDGLVWLSDAFAWFPRPYEILGPATPP